jgi:hypothetical protein
MHDKHMHNQHTHMHVHYNDRHYNNTHTCHMRNHTHNATHNNDMHNNHMHGVPRSIADSGSGMRRPPEWALRAGRRRASAELKEEATPGF